MLKTVDELNQLFSDLADVLNAPLTVDGENTLQGNVRWNNQRVINNDLEVSSSNESVSLQQAEVILAEVFANV